MLQLYNARETWLMQYAPICRQKEQHCINSVPTVGFLVWGRVSCRIWGRTCHSNPDMCCLVVGTHALNHKALYVYACLPPHRVVGMLYCVLQFLFLCVGDVVLILFGTCVMASTVVLMVSGCVIVSFDTAVVLVMGVIPCDIYCRRVGMYVLADEMTLT